MYIKIYGSEKVKFAVLYIHCGYTLCAHKRETLHCHDDKINTLIR